MKAKWPIVFFKEFRETLRDRRSLMLLVLFTLMYPVMLGVILNQQIKRATKPEREGIELAVIGAAQAPNLMAQLKQKNVMVQPVGAMSEEAIGELLRARKVVALLRITDKFAENYQAMRPARVGGLPAYPRLQRDHPLAGVEPVLRRQLGEEGVEVERPRQGLAGLGQHPFRFATLHGADFNTARAGRHSLAGVTVVEAAGQQGTVRCITPAADRRRRVDGGTRQSEKRPGHGGCGQSVVNRPPVAGNPALGGANPKAS